MDSFRRLIVSFKINYSIDEHSINSSWTTSHLSLIVPHTNNYIRYMMSLYMPPRSYVVSFGDIHRYLVETRTTFSQEGIVRWTVILRNLGLFPCGSSSTRYELRGGIVWIQLPKERSLKGSASLLLHSSSPYNLTYIYPRRISSSSHHYS